MKQIVLDNWLSSIMGKPAYVLHDSINLITRQDLPNHEIFIWTKIPINDLTKLENLQKLGFYIVDTNIQLSMKTQRSELKNINIRFATSNDEKAIKNIAKNSFKNSRFHSDPQISEKVACKIKEEWAGNFFSGKRGRWMVVAEHNSTVVGFLQILSKSHDLIVIDLIAISEENRGKGYAKDMILFASNKCLHKNGIIEVGTQIANRASLDLYKKLGFRIISSSYVLHLHQ